MPEPFSFSGRLRSFGHALSGIAALIRSQHNAWIHGLATILVCATGAYLGISAVEWCLVVLAMVMVWVSEALNTAVELVCDVASPDPHPLIKTAKDVAAGAVLLSAIGAAIIGVIVYLPYCMALLNSET